jgi:HPr kinase/phosphorylase
VAGAPDTGTSPPRQPPSVHGTTIAMRLPAGWVAAMIRGPSGAGKSDLALRCLSGQCGPLVPYPTILVADDRTILLPTGAYLSASAPDTLRGLIEVRGVGLLTVPFLQSAPLVLLVDLVTPALISRLPDGQTDTLDGGCIVPLLKVSAFQASSPLKVLLALALAAKSAHGHT